jgi:putative tryptophan/tyrosine transport system substrate-binding protein
MSGFGRREFAALLGGAASWPIVASAQQAGKLPTIGLLAAGTRSSHSEWVAAFMQRLGELGWNEGRTVAIEYRWAEGSYERAAEIAAELVRARVDVIIVSGTAILAARQATSTIPIVFPVATDPVAAGWVGSLARPGGNVTGLSQQRSDSAGKRLELLREVVPGMRRVAIMSPVGNPGSVAETGDVQTAARTLGLEVVRREIRRAADIALGFEALKGVVDALYVVSDALIFTNRVRMITLAQHANLPTVYSLREYVESGGLMSYGPNFRDMWRRAAEYVDKILRGAKPADIPIEQPITFDLVINLITAKVLGLEVPPSLLARADEVIE